MDSDRLSAWNQLFWRQYEPKRFDTDGKGRQRKPSCIHQLTKKAPKKRHSIELPQRSDKWLSDKICSQNSIQDVLLIHGLFSDTMRISSSHPSHKFWPAFAQFVLTTFISPMYHLQGKYLNFFLSLIKTRGWMSASNKILMTVYCISQQAVHSPIHYKQGGCKQSNIRGAT